MKKQLLNLLKFGVSCSLLGTAIVGVNGLTASNAMALTEEQALSHFSDVPLFSISDPKGNPLKLTYSANGENKEAVAFFWSYQGAKQQLDELLKKQPEVGNKVQILPIGYDVVIKGCSEAVKTKKTNCLLTLNQPQVKNALDLLVKEGELVVKDNKYVTKKDGKEIVPDNPLFIGYTVKDGKQVPLTIPVKLTKDGKEETKYIVPHYTSLKDLQTAIANVNKQQPDIEVNIGVASFRSHLAYLLKLENVTELNSLIVPDSEARKKAVELVQQHQSSQKAQPEKAGEAK